MNIADNRGTWMQRNRMTVTPLLFLLLTGWTLTYTVTQRPAEGLMSAGIIVSGAVFYFLTQRIGRTRNGF